MEESQSSQTARFAHDGVMRTEGERRQERWSAPDGKGLAIQGVWIGWCQQWGVDVGRRVSAAE